MIELVVCRGSSVVGECLESDDALKWGSDLSDPLLTTAPPGYERGRVEIDSSYSNRKDVSITLPYQTWRQPGQIIGIAEGPVVTNGLLQDITLTHTASKDAIQVGSEITVEREV